jgi:hypothetical protein
VQLKRKLPWILTGKALLATGSIAMVALALVTYTATVNISFTTFFTLGQNSLTWTALSTSSGTRYLPGDTVVPGTPTIGTTSSFAFETITGKGYVKISLSANVPTADFSQFRVFVLTFNSTTWNNATLYASPTYSTTGHVIGVEGTGTNASALVAYLLIGQTPQVFYALQINYILTGNPSGTPSVTFDYVPSLN